MSAHVLLNLLNELRKRDKMRELPSVLSLFCNEFYKFNNTGARIMPTKRSDAQLLVEREKQLECRPVEISRSLKGKEMLHVLYIIINISCLRKRIKNRAMSCNLLRVPAFMV